MTSPGTAEVDGATDSAAEARARLRRGRLVTGVVAGVLAVVVGVVALLGGFRTRTDLARPVAVGSVIATGPYEVTITRATSRPSSLGDGWRVEVSGTARTTGDTSVDPPTGDSGFVYARSVSTREVQASDTVALAAPGELADTGVLTPGLPPVPWTVSFTFARPPGDTLLVAVFDQEYTTPWIFGDERGWRATRDASTMTLPLEQLPEQ